MENNNREAGVEDIVNYMATLDPTKSNNNMNWNSSPSTEISQPSSTHLVRASTDHFSSNDRSKQIMSCIHGLAEKVSQLAASVKTIVSAWNGHNFMDSDEVRGSITLFLLSNHIFFNTILCLVF